MFPTRAVSLPHTAVRPTPFEGLVEPFLSPGGAPVLSMSHLKAFIVEDSPVIRENLVAALEEMAPIDVVGTAEDESGAVAWLVRSENHCDLVVVDIFLKSGSGLGVLKAAASSGLPAKLVVLSNYATPDMRRKCLELGADRVFDKSNEIDALILYCCRLADGGTGGSEYGSLS